MATLHEYIISHTERGECKCGQCIDVGDKPDQQGHTADLIFFKVAAKGLLDSDEFARLSREHRGEFGACDPFDGKEHGYMELGGWLGDQGIALRYMALGKLLGMFDLLTPRTVLGNTVPDELALQMAGAGLVTVKAVNTAASGVGA